jgi:hypothetical protein
VDLLREPARGRLALVATPLVVGESRREQTGARFDLAGAAQADALAGGYQRGLLVAAGIALANLVAGVFTAPRIKPDAALVAEAAAA